MMYSIIIYLHSGVLIAVVMTDIIHNEGYARSARAGRSN